MDKTLRQSILDCLENDSPQGWTSTPWISSWIDCGKYGAKAIRVELEKMERDGLVKSDRTRSNRTFWTIKDQSNG